MRTTITLAQNMNCSPFDIFAKEIDEVIMVINFYIELGEDNNSTNQTNKIANKKAVKKNNDGFWDM